MNELKQEISNLLADLDRQVLQFENSDYSQIKRCTQLLNYKLKQLLTLQGQTNDTAHNADQ